MLINNWLKILTEDSNRAKAAIIFLYMAAVFTAFGGLLARLSGQDPLGCIMEVHWAVSVVCLFFPFFFKLFRYYQKYAVRTAEIIATVYAVAMTYIAWRYDFKPELAYLSLGIFLVMFAFVSSKRFVTILIVAYFATVTLALLMTPKPLTNVPVFLFSAVALAVPNYLSTISRFKMIRKSNLDQENLKQSEERFQNIFDNAPIGIVLLDNNFNIVRFNKKLIEITGYEDDLLFLSGPSTFIFQQESQPDPVKLTSQILRSPHKNYISEFRLIKKSGDVAWVHYTATLVDIDGNKNSHFLFMLEDITENKANEEKMREYANQLANHNKALEEFTYVISHDLQEPLRIITLYTQMLERRMGHDLTPELKVNLDFIVDGAKRMSQLIKDMLEYSRWSTREMPVEDVETNDVLVEVLKNLAIAMKYGRATVESEHLPSLHTNKLLLGQVLQNLIGNSIKYAHPQRKPCINISSEVHDETVTISIKDNGIGFDEKDSDRIFGIFQRLHGRDSHYQGSGIGLAICKRIIEKQGGKIWAESKPGEGSVFHFSLPA